MNLRELHLYASDLGLAKHFYSAVLGRLCRADKDIVRVSAGASTLVLHAAPDGRRCTYHFAFNVPETQFAEAKAWVAQQVPLHHDLAGQDEFAFTSWNAHAAYFFDPLGNIVEIIARHALTDGGVRPFNPSGLRCVSEIGLPVDNVQGAVTRSRHVTGAAVYDGALSTVFTALGDEHGLLIIVKRGRDWYPDTRLAAVDLPLRVVVENRQGETVDVIPALQAD